MAFRSTVVDGLICCKRARVSERVNEQTDEGRLEFTRGKVIKIETIDGDDESVIASTVPADAAVPPPPSITSKMFHTPLQK